MTQLQNSTFKQHLIKRTRHYCNPYKTQQACLRDNSAQLPKHQKLLVQIVALQDIINYNVSIHVSFVTMISLLLSKEN